MLESKKEKEPTKAELQEKVEAWKTLNSVLVKTNAEFMNSLKIILEQKISQQKVLEEKLKKNEGSEQDNAEYLFIGGYIQCLKDILGGKRDKA